MTDKVEALMARGDWVSALAEAKTLSTNVPTSAKLHGYVGLCHFRMQQFEDASKSFGTALTLDEKYFDVALKLAQCLDRLTRYPEALEAARVAHRLHPSDPTVNVLIHGLERQVHDSTTDAWQKTAHLSRHQVMLSSEE